MRVQNPTTFACNGNIISWIGCGLPRRAMGASQSLCRAKAAGCDWEGAPAPVEVIEAAAAPPEQDAIEPEEIICRFQAAIPGAASECGSEITARQDSKTHRRVLLNRALVPDVDIMRGISLQSTLVWGGRLWRLAPSLLPEKELANRCGRSFSFM